MKNFLPLIISFLALALSSFSFSQPGSLDTQFGNNGTVMDPVTSTTEHGYAMTVQEDGKLLVAGFRDLGGNQDFAVARYNTDGSLDNSFGNNGVALFDGGSDADAAWAMALQADGKIMLGGSVYNQSTTVDDFALIRLNTDGSPDATFGNNGIVTTDFDDKWDNAYEILVQDDGKILLGGDGYTLGKRNVCIARYNTDGSLDTDFGFLGISFLSVGTVNDRTRDIALQSDGKIIAAGYANDGADDQAFVARFNSNGTVDTFFGLNGMAVLDIGGREDRFYTVVILEDDAILAAGHTRDETAQDNDYLFVKYDSEGALDTDFGSNGIKLYNFGANDNTQDMAIQQDGKILSAGGAFSYEILRLLPDGSLDNEFGDNGKVNTTIGTYCHANRIMLYNDLQAVVAGHALSGDFYNFALARYHLQDNAGIRNATQKAINLIVFPNPATERVTVQYKLERNQMLSLDLINLQGTSVCTFIGASEKPRGFHTDDFLIPPNVPPGIYFLKLSLEHRSVYSKLIID